MMQPVYLIRTDESKGSIRVDRFPEPSRAVTTINIVTSHFVGSVLIEATIKLVPEENDWFIAHEEEFPQFESQDETRRSVAVNLVGRFISMRATATKDQTVSHGIVDRVTVI